MRELDVLLERFLAQRYADLSGRAREAFARLLDLPDPVILSYLLGRERPQEAELADVVRQITTPACD